MNLKTKGSADVSCTEMKLDSLNCGMLAILMVMIIVETISKLMVKVVATDFIMFSDLHYSCKVNDNGYHFL